MDGSLVPGGPHGLTRRPKQELGKQPLTDAERHDVEEHLSRLEYHLKYTVMGDERRAQYERIWAELRHMLAEDDLLKQEVVPPDGEPATRDNIDMHGDAGPGAVIGGGSSTIKGGAAGRDHVTADTHIAHAEHVHIGSEGLSGVAAGDLERTYLLRLMTTANRVPLAQLDLKAVAPGYTMPEVRLDAVYVPLDTTQTQHAVGGREGERASVPLLTAVIRHRWLVVLGDPGSGKTTFTNYLSVALAGARLHPDRNYEAMLNVSRQGGQRAANWSYGPLLPVRIDLRRFAYYLPKDAAGGTADMVWSHLAAELERHNLGPFAPQVHALLVEGQCLVMFDGLDEIANVLKRRLVREAIRDFADEYAGCRIVVTCRTLSYTHPDWQITGFVPVTIAPLSREAIGAFIENWYLTLARLEAIPPDQYQDKAAQLRLAVEDLTDLAQNPLLLTVMALVHTYKGTLPRERVRLYNDCVNLLLWDWQAAKQVAPGVWEDGILDALGTREERLISGLCRVAFEAHRSGGAAQASADIPQAELFRILKEYLDDSYGKAQQFGRYVEERAGLLVSRGKAANGDDLYAFVHRGFQEFLAGRHIVSGRSFSRQVIELAAEGDIWREVLLLAVGHQVYNLQQVDYALDAINLLCKVDTPRHDGDWRAIWLAGEMLHIVGRSAAEQDSYVGRELYPRVVEKLVALVETGSLTPAERAQAGDVLGLLGDPRPGVCRPDRNSIILPDLIDLPGGAFEIGSDEDGRHRLKIGPFKLARYPVTNAQFRQFADRAYHNETLWTASGLEWRKRTGQRRGLIADPVWGIDNRPVVAVTWHEALAYAAWLRRETGLPFRLPTEVEWERAAAGSEGRRYPFGERARDMVANYREARIGQTCAVGLFPQDRTPEGVADLGGNVWEWTSSLHKSYPYRAGDGREKPDAPGSRVLRGGAYDSARSALHCTHRLPVDPTARVTLIGFRVACDG